MVAERGFSPPQQCTSERIAKHAADVLIPLLREEIVDIVRTISHERIKQRIVEKIADVPVLSIQTQLSNIVDVLDAIRKNLEQMQNDMFRVKTNREDLVMKHIDDKVRISKLTLRSTHPYLKQPCPDLLWTVRS